MTLTNFYLNKTSSTSVVLISIIFEWCHAEGVPQNPHVTFFFFWAQKHNPYYLPWTQLPQTFSLTFPMSLRFTRSRSLKQVWAGKFKKDYRHAECERPCSELLVTKKTPMSATLYGWLYLYTDCYIESDTQVFLCESNLFFIPWRLLYYSPTLGHLRASHLF